jgi:hypothetical protein
MNVTKHIFPASGSMMFYAPQAKLWLCSPSKTLTFLCTCPIGPTECYRPRLGCPCCWLTLAEQRSEVFTKSSFPETQLKTLEPSHYDPVIMTSVWDLLKPSKKDREIQFASFPKNSHSWSTNAPDWSQDCQCQGVQVDFNNPRHTLEHTTCFPLAYFHIW